MPSNKCACRVKMLRRDLARLRSYILRRSNYCMITNETCLTSAELNKQRQKLVPHRLKPILKLLSETTCGRMPQVSQDDDKLEAHVFGQVSGDMIAIVQCLTRLKGFAIDTAHWMGVWLPSSPRYLTRMFATHKTRTYLKITSFVTKLLANNLVACTHRATSPDENALALLAVCPYNPAHTAPGLAQGYKDTAHISDSMEVCKRCLPVVQHLAQPNSCATPSHKRS